MTIPSRRERVRDATMDEIRQVARRLLVSEGLSGVSLRAIAREMGMSAPGLYRYYGSLEDLIEALTAELLDELTGDLEAACDALPSDDIVGRLFAACRELRRWALAHRAEFGLVFASPPPDRGSTDDSPVHAAGMRFGSVFAALMAELWARRGFPTPDPDEIDPTLRPQLEFVSELFGRMLPPPAAFVYLRCWTRLYGMVCMEVFDQLCFALDNVEPMFEDSLRDLSARLELPYRPPAS